MGRHTTTPHTNSSPVLQSGDIDTYPPLLLSAKGLSGANQNLGDFSDTFDEVPLRRMGSEKQTPKDIPKKLKETSKRASADQLIENLIRQNAEAIEEARKSSSNISIASSASQVSSTYFSAQRKIKLTPKTKVNPPKRLQPMESPSDSRLLRYAGNARNSKAADICPVIEPVL
jgi:hypothetical protein